MKKTLLLTCLLLLMFSFKANALRSMYVNGFSSILGDETEENNLLSYAQNNGIEKLLLYELHLVNSKYNMSNVATNQVLADFISKAKTDYGIIYMGATGETSKFFANVVDTYNRSRENDNEKFDVYNLEFEFWNNNVTADGKYYCNAYLESNNLPCTKDGAFEYFITTLQEMRELAHNNPYTITTEAYVGWPTTEQAITIGSNLDNLLLHAYVSEPSKSFSYTQNRLIDFATGKPGLNVSIIFSSESNFMQDWLLEYSMSEAERIYTEDWVSGSANWTNNINLEGFTYFTYSHNKEISLSTNLKSVVSTTKVFPNPVQDILYVESVNKIQRIKIYNAIGELVKETTVSEINFEEFSSGIYVLKIFSDKGVETKKIVKQ